MVDLLCPSLGYHFRPDDQRLIDHVPISWHTEAFALGPTSAVDSCWTTQTHNPLDSSKVVKWSHQ